MIIANIIPVNVIETVIIIIIIIIIFDRSFDASEISIDKTCLHDNVKIY